MDLNQKTVKCIENLINIYKNKVDDETIMNYIVESFSSDLTPLELNYLKNKYFNIFNQPCSNQQMNIYEEISNDEQSNKRRKIS